MTISAAFAGSASADVLYSDSFSRTGILDGSTPDVATTNGQTWQQTNANGGSSSSYVLNGSSVSEATGGQVDGWSYLPVNGGSGVTLDGTVDFTLSATVSTGATQMGIMLNTAIFQGGGMFNGGQPQILAALGFKQGYNGSTATYTSSANPIKYYNDPPASDTISITYSAANSTLSYIVGSTTIATETGVTSTDIAALNYVGIGNGAYGNNPTSTLDNFSLTTAGGSAPAPEPSTYALMLGGLGSLAMIRRRLRKS